MSGKLHDVQVYIRQKHQFAFYVYCATCSVNLASSEACSVAPIRNYMEIVKRYLKILFCLLQQAQVSICFQYCIALKRNLFKKSTTGEDQVFGICQILEELWEYSRTIHQLQESLRFS
jgi:hypothetical protein